MNNPPSFQFYPQDFISDLNVQSMTDAEVGRYIKLLCHCWIEDGLEIGSPLVDRWLKVGSILLRCFVEKGGKYRNKRLDRERQKQINWREKSSRGGSHSAENKKNPNQGTTKAQPKGNQGSTLLSSSSSSIDKSRDLSIKAEFSQFWESYPEKQKKTDALKAFEILRRTEKLETIAAAFNGYMDFLKHKRIKENFEQRPMYAATFLRNERWKEYVGFTYKAPL
jgi:uncharacterized protein YdaU (DUF1376 family)